jgi:hypothetical protein
MAGFFDSDVWSITMLQVSHDERFARHAIIALGALYTAIDSVPSLSFPSSPQDLQLLPLDSPHRVYALQQYGKALQLMRRVPQQKTSSWVRNAVISCLLTTYFEAYIGNLENAIAQAGAGIDLIDRIHVSSNSPSSDDFGYLSTTSSLIDSDLIGIFARLEAVVKYFQEEHQIKWTSRPLRTAPPPAAIFLENIPSSFASTKEAKYCWDILVARFIRYRDSFFELNDNFDDGKVQKALFKPDYFIEEMQQGDLPVFAKACTKWFQAFSPILQRSRENPGTNEFFSASVMHLQYLTSIIVLSLSVEKTECACDRFLDEYITIIDHAEAVLEATHNRSASGSSRAMFAFDCNLIWSLKLVGTKCRDRKVRRRAIGLMRKYPRREGCRDNEMSAAVTTWLMDMEEEGVVSEHVPEKRRLKVVKSNESLNERRAMIVCSRLIEGREEREELPPAIITW